MTIPTDPMKRIARNSRQEDRGYDTACDVWLGYVDKGGYGTIKVGSETDGSLKLRKIHVVAWEHATGRKVPDGKQLDHLCDQPDCHEPTHLKVSTARENVLRSKIAPAAVNARKTRCNRGHPLSGQNLHVNPKGERVCRTCRREDMRACRARKRAA